MHRTYKKEPKKLRKLVGRTSTIKEAVRYYKVSPDFAAYWRRKAKDKTFHPEPQGGLKWSKFSAEEHYEIRYFIWERIRINPLSRYYFIFFTFNLIN